MSCLRNFVLVILCPALTLAAFGDPCDVITSSDLAGSDDQVINVTFPKDCLFGAVNWNYPKGSLLLTHTAADKNFKLCIEEGWTVEISRVQEVKNGHSKTLPLPTKDKPTCTDSSNGEAALLVSAPEGQRYMTMFNYRIVLQSKRGNKHLPH
uniref:GOLD domain-containing protein n=1 Tax=Biomphalaria glabrata TaxID=6526 RepID=A0A2C9LDZ7_BIOGL